MFRDNTSTSTTLLLKHRGFTLIESMVVLAAFGLIMAVAFGIFSTLSQTTVQNNQLARSQAGARVALEEIERALRSAGAEVDLAGGQQNFVWAGPYQLAFNSNLMPLQDPNGTGEPGALIEPALDDFTWTAALEQVAEQIAHLRPLDVGVGLEVGGEHRRHVAGAVARESLREGDGVLHRQLGPRADGEVSGMGGVAQEHDVVLVPGLALDGREAPPEGSVTSTSPMTWMGLPGANEFYMTTTENISRPIRSGWPVHF